MIDISEKEIPPEDRELLITLSLYSPTNRMLDVIPYGGIESPHGQISWPPEHDTKMSVVGFPEARNTAKSYLVSRKPEIVVQVVEPAVFIALKMVAWSERPADIKGKDALDIAEMISTYEKIIVNDGSAFEDNALLETYDFDTLFISAFLLGKEISQIANTNLADRLLKISNSEIKGRELKVLHLDMYGKRPFDELEFDRIGKLMKSLFSGLKSHLPDNLQ